MDSIRLRNIRSLADTGEIKLKPITLLLGQNSSGKSTVLRTLPLLLQSIRTRSNAPILWYGDFVDFGSVKDVRSTFASDQGVQFEFNLGKTEINNRNLLYIDEPSSSSPRVTLTLDLIESDGKTRLNTFQLKFDSDILIANVDTQGSVTKLDVNGLDFTRFFPSDKYRFTTSDIVPQLISNNRNSFSNRFGVYHPYGRMIDACEREISGYLSISLHKRLSEERISSIIRRIPYAPGKHFEKKLGDATDALVSGRKLFETLTGPQGRKDLKRLRSLFLLGQIGQILSAVERAVTKTFNNVSYVGPSRATGERYYRLQELAVDQIDPQGRNLAMFLNSLSTLQQNRFSSWLKDAIGYDIKVERSSGHIQILLREASSQKFFNIADMGYGFSQVLPIMAQVWTRGARLGSTRFAPTIVAMEQPELHLHPAYQAKLAKVFAKSVSSVQKNQGDIRFVIETHSESLINEIGNLVYRGELNPKEVAIYIFEKDNETEITSISYSSFDQDGTLNNWPVGFFSAAS